MDLKLVGQIIHNRRKELGLTLEDVGDYLGVYKSTVMRWEKGEFGTFKRGHIYLLSKVLHMPVETIMGLETTESVEDAEIVKQRIRLNNKIDSLGKEELDQIEKFIKDWLKA